MIDERRQLRATDNSLLSAFEPGKRDSRTQTARYSLTSAVTPFLGKTNPSRRCVTAFVVASQFYLDGCLLNRANSLSRVPLITDGIVLKAKYTCDGRYLVIITSLLTDEPSAKRVIPQRAMVYDVSTGKFLPLRPTLDYTIVDMDIGERDKLLLACTDGYLRVTDALTGRLLLERRVFGSSCAAIAAIHDTPNCLIAGSEEAFKVVNYERGEVIATFPLGVERVSDNNPVVCCQLHITGVNSLVASSSGRFYATGDNSGLVNIWSSDKRAPTRSLRRASGTMNFVPGRQAQKTTLEFSRDEAFIVAGSGNDLVRWSTNGSEPDDSKALSGLVTAVSYASYADCLAALVEGTHSGVVLIDSKSSHLISRLSFPSQLAPQGVSWCPKGRQIAIYGSGGLAVLNT